MELPENICNMDDSQRINKYDSILDAIFIGTKYTTKAEIVHMNLMQNLLKSNCQMD